MEPQQNPFSTENNKKAIYMLVDTEASGFHPHKHGLLEVAALALDKDFEVVDTYCSYINPPNDVAIDPEAMAVNNITQEQIQKGITYKQFCKNFIGFIEQNFESRPIAVAQFYPFDNAYLNYVFEVCGYDSRLLSNILGNDFIDTKSLVNAVNAKARMESKPLPFPITSLSKEGGLKDILKISGNYKSHTAMGDVLATRDVLVALLEYLK